MFHTKIKINHIKIWHEAMKDCSMEVYGVMELYEDYPMFWERSMHQSWQSIYVCVCVCARVTNNTKLVMPTIVSLYVQGWSDWTMQKFLKSGLLQVDNLQILKVKSKTNRCITNKTLHSTSALNCNISHHFVQARSDPNWYKWLWKVNILLIFTETCGPLQ